MAGNTFNTPILSEPDIGGGWHVIAAPTDNWLLNQVVAAGPTWYTVTFPIGTGAGQCPVGTRLVQAFVEAVTVAGTMYWRPTGSGAAVNKARILLDLNLTTAPYGAVAMIPIDSNGQVDFTGAVGETIRVAYPSMYCM